MSSRRSLISRGTLPDVSALPSTRRLNALCRSSLSSGGCYGLVLSHRLTLIPGTRSRPVLVSRTAHRNCSSYVTADPGPEPAGKVRLQVSRNISIRLRRNISSSGPAKACYRSLQPHSRDVSKEQVAKSVNITGTLLQRRNKNWTTIRRGKEYAESVRKFNQQLRTAGNQSSYRTSRPDSEAPSSRPKLKTKRNSQNGSESLIREMQRLRDEVEKIKAGARRSGKKVRFLLPGGDDDV